MNNFSFTNKDGENVSQLVVTTNSESANTLIAFFNENFPKEMLNGEQNALPNGGVEIKLELSNKDADAMKAIFLCSSGN